MKHILVVIDGVADKPSKELKGKTPLEAAYTPNLNYLAEHGKLGKMSIMNNYVPETEGAVLAIFGYNPLKYNEGRAPLEAYGSNINFNENDLIVRGNFATFKNNKIMDLRAGRIETEEAKMLLKDIERNVKLEGIKFKLIPTLNYRFILIFKGKNLSANVTNTNPAYKKIRSRLEVPIPTNEPMLFERCRPLDGSEKSKFTAGLINKFTEKVHYYLKKHHSNKKRIMQGKKAANFILMRGLGTKLPKLHKLKVKALCLGDTPAERGISKLLGMDVIELPAPKVDALLKNVNEIKEAVRHDMRIRINAFKNSYKKYSFFYFHIKGPDPLAHRGEAKLKTKMIESIDKHFFGPLLKAINLNDVKVAVTSDHTTACSLKAHSSDPVPLLIAGGKVKADGINKFNENTCKKGKIGLIKAEKFMKLYFTLTDKL